jgi:hypothetical protein
MLNLIEFCAGACVVRVPRMLHLREVGLELADERQDTYSVGEHGEWVSLGHAFFAEDKDGVTVVALEDEYRPVFLAIKYKPGPGRPLVSDRPQHFDPILSIECVGRIDEQEFSSVSCKSQRACIAWMPPSMPASRPA